MTMWDNVKSMLYQDAAKYTIMDFSPDQVNSDYDHKPFVEGEAYCRFWLVEMCLSKGVESFKHRYPIVHSAIRFNHGDSAVTIPQIAGPGFLKELTKKNMDRIIQFNHPLTPLFPFNNGLVEIQAGLFSMEANNWVKQFVTTLSRFSKLLPVPEFSNVLELTTPVYSGIEDLLGIGDRRLELGYQQTYAGAGGGGKNVLKPGYFAVIQADSKALNGHKLGVVDDRLCILKNGFTDSTPLTGFDYMLFRIEKRTHQDWESLPKIRILVNRARKALIQKKVKQVEELFINIRIAVIESNDLTKNDRRQMIRKIKSAIEECKLQAAGIKAENLSLFSIMQLPDPPEDPQLEAEIADMEDLLGIT